MNPEATHRMTAANAAAQHFALPGEPRDLEPFGNGHINRSYRFSSGTGSPSRRFLLQRLNTHVFPEPRLVMENVARVTAHLGSALRSSGLPDLSRRTLTLVPTRDAALWHRDEAGDWWRLFRFIEDARVCDHPTTPELVVRAGAAYGKFQRELSDWAGARLHETIPGFHDTPARLAAFEAVVASDRVGCAAEAAAEIAAIRDQAALAGALLEPYRRREIPERIVHNDAKLANVLLDAATGEALAVVDLDTVMPGLSLYDFGDMARSMTTEAAEDEPDLSRVFVRTDLFAALANGYLREAGGFLNGRERSLLVTSARVITFEQALRFLTDHLDGDRYYRTERPDQNLDRARAQLALLREFTERKIELEKIVARAW
jgi:hypothetical protein